MRPIGVGREQRALRILLIVVLAAIGVLMLATGADAATATTEAAPRTGALQPLGHDYDEHLLHVDPTVELAITPTSGEGGDIRGPRHSYDEAPNFARTSARQAARFVAPQTGDWPLRLVYEHNPKHGATTRWEGGREISRRPHGGQAEWQAILDAPVPNGPRHRRGIEPDTGLTVELRLHLEQPLECETVRYYHGYVPGG